MNNHNCKVRTKDVYAFLASITAPTASPVAVSKLKELMNTDLATITLDSKFLNQLVIYYKGGSFQFGEIVNEQVYTLLQILRMGDILITNMIVGTSLFGAKLDRESLITCSHPAQVAVCELIFK